MQQLKQPLLKTDFDFYADGYGCRITYKGEIIKSEGARHPFYRRGKPRHHYWDERAEDIIDNILDTRWQELTEPTRILISRIQQRAA